MPISIFDKVVVQILFRVLYWNKLEWLTAQRRRIGTLANSSRRRAVDPLGVAERRTWFPLDFKTIQAAVIEEEAEDDGQYRRHAARPDDDAPYTVNNLLALFFVQGVDAALHCLQMVLIVTSQYHPDAYKLGKGLPYWLHKKH